MTDVFNIVATTRVRLARNLRGYAFPHKIADEKVFEDIIDKISQPLINGTDMQLEKIKDMSSLVKQRYIEKHVISPELANLKRGAVVHTPDCRISVMLNEEDHIRIQAIADGFNVDKAMLAANEVESMISDELMLAYDDELGYLTACPSNLGTGMRISAMVHLPALTRAGAIGDLAGSLSKAGYTVRGTYGEGSDTKGCFYQISNDVTLGSTKREISESFKKVIETVCKNEKAARESLIKVGGISLEDKIMRSLGTLKYCKMISYGEAVPLLSDIAFGITQNIIRGTAPKVYAAIWDIAPACIANENDDAQTRDIRRAKYLNELFKEV